MQSRSTSVVSIVICGCIVMLVGTLRPREESAREAAAALQSEIAALPPSAAGLPSSAASSSAPGAAANTYVGGTTPTGRVAAIYVKVEQGVYLELDRAPLHLRETAERWADVQFPELLGNGAGAARAFMAGPPGSIRVGDVVQIRLAHKSSRESALYFPVKELTRVTQLVARRDEPLAREYEQRILARINGTTRQAESSRPAGLPPGRPAAAAVLSQQAGASR